MYKALESNPNSALAHYALAAVYLYQGSKELVPREVERAVRSRPGRPTAVHWLAHYHRLNGDYDAASQLWIDLLQRYPLFWPARVNYADVLLQAGEPAKAIREHEKFLEQAPESIFAIRGLARAWMSLNELEKARAVLESVPLEHRGNYHIRIARTLLAALEGQHDEAQESIDELLPFAGANALRTIEAAELYSALGETAKALDWLYRAVRNGDERVAWFQRDPLLASIREDFRFRRILSSVEYRRAHSGKARSKKETGS